MLLLKYCIKVVTYVRAMCTQIKGCICYLNTVFLQICKNFTQNKMNMHENMSHLKGCFCRIRIIPNLEITKISFFFLESSLLKSNQHIMYKHYTSSINKLYKNLCHYTHFIKK